MSGACQQIADPQADVVTPTVRRPRRPAARPLLSRIDADVAAVIKSG